MDNTNIYEFDEDGRPLVNEFDEFASKSLQGMLICLFYLTSLSIGLHNDEFLLKSPLMVFISFIAVSCATAIDTLLAFLIVWGVFGHFDFVEEVLSLVSHTDFQVGVGCVLLAIPAAIFFIKITGRLATSCKSKTAIFFIALSFTLFKLFSVFEHIKDQKYPDAYLFSFLAIGIIYFVLLKYALKPRRHRRRIPRIPDS